MRGVIDTAHDGHRAQFPTQDFFVLLIHRKLVPPTLELITGEVAHIEVAANACADTYENIHMMSLYSPILYLHVAGLVRPQQNSARAHRLQADSQPLSKNRTAMPLVTYHVSYYYEVYARPTTLAAWHQRNTARKHDENGGVALPYIAAKTVANIGTWQATKLSAPWLKRVFHRWGIL